MMESSDRSIIITLLIIPFAGLLYCALVMGAMLSLPTLRDHPLLSGGVAALIPLVTGAAIWISASARAYRR